MKIGTFGLGICLLITPGLFGESAAPAAEVRAAFETQGLLTPAQDYNFSRVSRVRYSFHRHTEESVVVSLQQLQHQTNERARRFAQSGWQEYERHHNTEALGFLQQAVAADPRSAVLQNNLGLVYCELGQHREAQQAFENAVKLDSSAAVSYANLAAVAMSTEQYGLAEQSARQALRLAPTSPHARVLLGLAEAAQKRWTPEARRLLEENRSHFIQAELALQNWPSVADTDPATAHPANAKLAYR